MRSIIFCSSQRNAILLRKFINELKEAAPHGVNPIIYDPCFDSDSLPESFRNLNEAERMKDASYRASVVEKVLKHNDLIPVADVCYIFNPDGYIGNNTHAELVAAAILKKHRFAYCKPLLMGEWPNRLHEEPSATAYIYNDPVSDPKELIKYLL